MPQLTVDQAIEVGLTHHRAGRLPEAEAVYRQVLAVAPDHFVALQLLGALAAGVGNLEVAIQLTERAIALRPDFAECHMNLGEIYRRAGKPEKGLAPARRALELRPDLDGARGNLGLILRDMGKYAEAKPLLRAEIARHPENFDLRMDLANAHWAEGEHDEALAIFRRAAAEWPTNVTAHWSMARILLQKGQMEEGWQEFEWRLKHSTMRLDRGFVQPQWDGSDPSGKTILLHAEGGLGDALQFVRLAPMVAQRGASVVLECQETLAPLFEGMVGVQRVVARGKELPEFNFHIPMQGLPRILGITLKNIPDRVPYLSVPEDRKRKWAERIPASGGKARVGVVWAGSPNNDMEFRSRSIELFYPMLKIPGFQFFSLQTGEDSRRPPPEGIDWVDLTAELRDMADTAALVEKMDLVISVDTSVAHLAGALARPVWVLIPSHSDFRWLLERADSPWYPTMRLFRQDFGGKWEDVAERITGELKKFGTS
jgi:tetratricopeptide (TPR) repeat protein